MAVIGQNESKAPVVSAKELDREFLPRHVAIIMDGNGRWAQEARHAAHIRPPGQGVEALREIIKYSDELGIEALTIYAFSAENWKRPRQGGDRRPDGAYCWSSLTSEIDELDEKRACASAFWATLTAGAQGAGKAAERAAGRHAPHARRTTPGCKLNIALNYGSRQEIVRAAQTTGRNSAGKRRHEAGGHRPKTRLRTRIVYPAGLPRCGPADPHKRGGCG